MLRVPTPTAGAVISAPAVPRPRLHPTQGQVDGPELKTSDSSFLNLQGDGKAVRCREQSSAEIDAFVVVCLGIEAHQLLASRRHLDEQRKRGSNSRIG